MNIKNSITRGIYLGVSLLFTASTAFAVPTLYCVDGPGGNNTQSIDLVTTGCISGTSNSYPNGGDGEYSNAGGGDPEAKVEAAIFDATNTVVDISLYGKSDVNPTLFTFNVADPSTVFNGTWSVKDGTLISYITVKAANSFALYELASPASSGVFDSIGILNNPGNQPTVSHISFWTAAHTSVPEPATAGLLLAGLLGFGARVRKKV